MIGSKLRALRKKSKFRLKDVSQETGISASYISQMETGKVEPSISVLRKLAAFYKVGTVYFFDTSQNGNILVKANQRPKYGQPNSPLKYELLRKNLNDTDLQLAVIKIAPNYEEPKGLFISCKSEEFIYVLSGKLGFEYNGEMYYAEAGDSLCYDASQPYRLFNPTDNVTEILGVGSPKSLLATEYKDSE